MQEQFETYIYREIHPHAVNGRSSLIKGDKANIAGNVKVDIEEDSDDGVKIVLKKDKNDNIKEIKFVCTCGQSKSIVLDYSE